MEPDEIESLLREHVFWPYSSARLTDFSVCSCGYVDPSPPKTYAGTFNAAVPRGTSEMVETWVYHVMTIVRGDV